MKIRIVAAAISELIRISSSRSRIRSSTNVPLRTWPENAASRTRHLCLIPSCPGLSRRCNEKGVDGRDI
jgi:hypothetical protein